MPIREKVFIQLRYKILKGDFEYDERLNEKVLAEKLNVSRTPVREALHKLELEGLVEIVPRKYCRVIGIRKESIHEINLIRSRLEPIVCMDAVSNITEEKLSYMKKMLEQTEEYFAKNDIEKVIYSNDQFHNTLINSSINYKRIIRLLENLHDYVVAFRYSFMMRDDLVKRTIDEHKQIYEAVKQKDTEKVGILTTKHLEGILEYEEVVLSDMHKLKRGEK